MIRWIWMVLFICFSIYTTVVYFNCDVGNANKIEAGVSAGMQTWQDKNCQSCHQLYGLGGYMGPDLTNVASEKGKGPDYMRAFIKSGTGQMPNFHLSDTEVLNVIAFLEWVDRSGRSKVNGEDVHWTGSYNLSKRK